MTEFYRGKVKGRLNPGNQGGTPRLALLSGWVRLDMSNHAEQHRGFETKGLLTIIMGIANPQMTA